MFSADFRKMKLIFPAVVAVILIALPRVSALDAVAAATTNGPKPAAVSENIVVARGKGFVIKQRAMEQVMANTIAANPEVKLLPDADWRILSQLIEIQLVLQKATDEEKAEALRKNDENFTNIIKTLGEKELERRLEATEMTADELRLVLFQEDAAQTSLTRQLDIHVTDAEAKKFFDGHPGAYDKPEMARIRELVLMTTTDWTRSDAPPLPDATLEARHKLIISLHNRILAGEDFAALARQYNEHPLSKDSNDELTLIKDQMEISDLAFSLKTNQISDVVTNERNYCIFQLLEIIPAKKPGYVDVADQIKKLLIGEQKQAMGPSYIRKLWKEAGVEVLDPKLKAEEEANEAARAEAENKTAEFMKNAEAAAKVAAQFTNASPNSRIPAPQAPPAQP